MGARARGTGHVRGRAGARGGGATRRRTALRLDRLPVQERPGHRGGRAPPSGVEPGPAAGSRFDLVRGGHAGQRSVPHGRLPTGAQPRDPRGGTGAAAVLSRARLPPAAGIPGRLSAALRARGSPRGDPHRQWLPAGVRPHRADAPRPRRFRGHRAAVVSARDAGVSRLRRPALARADDLGRARRRCPRAAPRAPVAQARLLPAQRPQSDRSHDGGARAAAAPGGGGAPPASRSWRTASMAPSSTPNGLRLR